jgi:hypothetical protein
VKYNQGAMPPKGSFFGGGVFASFSAGKKKRKDYYRHYLI